MYTLEKIRKDYYELVKTVKGCRGKNDHETIKNLLQQFNPHDVEFNGIPALEYENQEITFIRIEEYDSLDYVYFWNWDRGNDKLDIKFDIYSDCAVGTVIHNIGIDELHKEYWKYLKEDENTEICVVNRLNNGMLDRTKIVRGYKKAEKVMSDWLAEDLTYSYKSSKIDLCDIEERIYRDYKCNDIEFAGDWIYNDVCGSGYVYQIIIPEV